MSIALQKLVNGGQRTLILSSLAVVMLVGLVFGPMAESAAAVTCREQTMYASSGSIAAPDGWLYLYTHNSSGQEHHTVPGSSVSGCSYINVKNITGGTGSNGTCWWFRGHINYVWQPEVYRCAGPTTVTGLYGPVANGSIYAVYIAPNSNVQFTLRN